MRYVVMAACLTMSFAACGGGDGDDNPGNNDGNGNNNDDNDPNGDQCAVKYGYGEGYLSDITIDTTWKNTGSACDVLIEGGLSVTSGHLTIEPGVVVKFTQDADIFFDDGGGVSAVGTADKHIVFKGLADVDGYAVGIFFNSAANESWFDYVDFRNLGKENPGGLEPGGALGGHDGGGVHITNCTVERSRIAGMALDALPLLDFANNAFNDNDGPGVTVAAHQLGLLDTTSDYLGTAVANGRPYIYVDGLSDASIVQDTTVKVLNAPYFVYNVVYLEGGTTTMEPGVHWVFDSGASFEIQEGSLLVAEGTADAHIRFSGEDGTAWDGLDFYEGDGNLAYVDIVNAYIGIDVTSSFGTTTVVATDIDFGNSSVGVCVDSVSSASLTRGAIDGTASLFVSEAEDEDAYDEQC